MRVTDLLDDLGITYFYAGTKSVRIKCLNPNHDDTNPSLFIDKSTGMCHCFPCGFSGNIYTILRNKTDLTKDEMDLVVIKYKSSSQQTTTSSSIEDVIDLRNKDLDVKYEDILLPEHRLLTSHPYLEKERGLTSDELQYWKMGVVTEAKNNGWVLVPIYQNGILRTFFLRNPFGEGKLYPSIYRSDILFGLDKCKNLRNKIYIVEGIFDAIIFQRTKKQCVASLSNILLPAQKSILKNYDEVVIVPDNDIWGNELLYSAQSLLNYTKVSVCKLPSHRHDAAECNLRESLEATYKEVPLLDYIFKRECIL